MRYKECSETLKWIKELIAKGLISQEEAEKHFPMLSISEDETIKNEIIEFFNAICNPFDEEPTEGISVEDIKEWIAWLEKQGNKDEEILVLKDQIESLHAAIKALKEAHKIELEKQGVQETLCDKCKKEHPSHSCQDITELGRCAVEHEQKPMLSDFFNAEYERGKADALKNVEWSEEDEKNLTQCIEAIDACYKWDSMIDWLKSIKQRHAWKPSEELIKALEKTLTYFQRLNAFGETIDNLKELHQQLKKL